MLGFAPLKVPLERSRARLMVPEQEEIQKAKGYDRGGHSTGPQRVRYWWLNRVLHGV
jgi:hypothetical protein